MITLVISNLLSNYIHKITHTYPNNSASLLDNSIGKLPILKSRNLWKALNDMHDCVSEKDEPVFDRCSVFKLNYSTHSHEELATWDRNK